MTTEEVVAALDTLSGHDPSGMHVDADNLLLQYVPSEVAQAYDRVVERAGDWWFA